MRKLLQFGFIFGTLAVLVSLGVWQLNRLQWKETKIAQYALAQETTPVPLLKLLAETEDTENLQYRRVTVSGHFMHDKELHLGGRRYYGNTGYEILTPLRLKDGRILLLNRGWVPFEYKEKENRPTDTYPAEAVELTGMIRLPHPPGLFTPDNHPEKNFWFTLDIPAMEQETGLKLLPMMVQRVEPGRERTDFPAPSDGKVVLRNDHLGYAITWFLLAIGAAVIFWLMLRKQKA